MSKENNISKKTVKIKESELVDLIDNIVNEAVATNKKNPINEMGEPAMGGANPLETKIDPNTIKSKSQLGNWLKQTGTAMLKAPQQELPLNPVQIKQIVDLVQASMGSDVSKLQRGQAIKKLGVTENKKRVVTISESKLVDLIDDIVNEAVKQRKK